MKTEDILLYGGLGLAAVWFLKSRNAAPPPAAIIAPPVNYTPSMPVQSPITTTTQAVAALPGLVTSVIKAFQGNPGVSNPSPVNNITDTTPVPVSVNTDVSSLFNSNSNDSLYKMFQNGDYSQMAGSSKHDEHMAMIGEY